MVTVSTYMSSMSASAKEVAGAVFMPNSITINSNNPHGVINADLGMVCSSSGICQYPFVKSIVEINFAAAIFSNICSV